MVKSRLGAATGWRRPPIFAALRLRPVSAQHTDAEGACIQRWATDRRQLVEIGVAEGASAAETRAVMHPDGELVLIDPYVDSRIPGLQFMRAVAHRIVASVDRGSVVWIDDYSANAAKTWDRPIDFLFIDGDHSVEGVRDDWEKWTRWISQGGVVLLHDSRAEAAWVPDDSGPVRVVRAASNDPAWEVVDEVDSITALQRA